jgi:hypothetical protein
MSSHPENFSLTYANDVSDPELAAAAFQFLRDYPFLHGVVKALGDRKMIAALGVAGTAMFATAWAFTAGPTQ